MKKFLFDKINLWVDGFTNSSVGMSGKKLTACAVTLTAICFPVGLWSIWAYKHNDWSLLIGVLTIIVASNYPLPSNPEIDLLTSLVVLFNVLAISSAGIFSSLPNKSIMLLSSELNSFAKYSFSALRMV
jgi:hypothetical protein